MKFDKIFFHKIKFNEEQLENILNSAKKDLLVAQKSKVVEVVFKFSYDAFLKFGMYF